MLRRGSRHGPLLAIAGALPLLLPPALAWARQDEERAVGVAHENARNLMRKGSWSEALDALKGIFTRHQGSAAVRARIADIEADLKQATFRVTVKPPDPEKVLGFAPKRFDSRSRKVRIEGQTSRAFLEVDSKAETASFKLPVPLERDLRVEFVSAFQQTSRKPEPLVLHCCIDEEDGTRYTIAAPMLGTLMPSDVLWSREGGIWLVRKSASISLVKETDRRSWIHRGENSVVLERKDTRITLVSQSIFDGKKMLPKTQLLSANDKTLRAGRLVITGNVIRDIEIDGTVEEKWHAARVAELEKESFAAWEKSGWDREKAIPEWAR